MDVDGIFSPPSLASFNVDDNSLNKITNNNFINQSEEEIVKDDEKNNNIAIKNEIMNISLDYNILDDNNSLYNSYFSPEPSGVQNPPKQLGPFINYLKELNSQGKLNQFIENVKCEKPQQQQQREEIIEINVNNLPKKRGRKRKIRIIEEDNNNNDFFPMFDMPMLISDFLDFDQEHFALFDLDSSNTIIDNNNRKKIKSTNQEWMPPILIKHNHQQQQQKILSANEFSPNCTRVVLSHYNMSPYQPSRISDPCLELLQFKNKICNCQNCMIATKKKLKKMNKLIKPFNGQFDNTA
jgi:hypothetical protein